MALRPNMALRPTNTGYVIDVTASHLHALFRVFDGTPVWKATSSTQFDLIKNPQNEFANDLSGNSYDVQFDTLEKCFTVFVNPS